MDEITWLKIAAANLPALLGILAMLVKHWTQAKTIRKIYVQINGRMSELIEREKQLAYRKGLEDAQKNYRSSDDA